MSALQIIITIIQLISCFGLVVVVLLQSGKSAGLTGSVFGGGNSDSFLARNKAKSIDATLARITKWLAGAFVLLTLVLHFVK
ncbi:MAG: preprotein translocase subunit SecG [Oscillospiraceae bacterium]|nr:preprotein translocase subunit SecG [Oscillospiraceae bacterium]